MAGYRPPLRDIRFTLESIVRLGEVLSLPAFEHIDLETAHDALEEGGRFFAEVVAPTNRAGDTVGAVRLTDGSVVTPPGFKEAYASMVESGWAAVGGPADFGGHGFPAVLTQALQEMLTASNMAFSLAPMLTASTILAIEQHGSPEQQAVYLDKLVSGEWTGTMVLTEPEAGSDVGALLTNATPNDFGGWQITGTKIFISWGEHDMAENIIHLVLARTPGAPPGTKGVSLFIVPKWLPDATGRPGKRNQVSCISIEDKLGIHGSPTCVMAFEGATAYLVGEINSGMRYMFTMMNDARLHVGLEGLGVAVRAFQLAVAHAAQRKQGRTKGSPTQPVAIIEHPDVRRMLMTMQASIEAMRGLLYDAAASIDRSRHSADTATRRWYENRAALLTPVAKAWATDLGVEIASMGIQIHGGMGYVEETGAAQLFRDARVAPIYEGTNGIQAIDLVTRKLRLDGGAVASAYLEEIAATVERLGRAGPDLTPVGKSLAESLAHLEAATAWLGEAPDTNDALAGATPYLDLFGLVAGGHYVGMSALAAESMDEPDGEGYLASKIASARFYAASILPRSAGLLPAVVAGSDGLYAETPG